MRGTTVFAHARDSEGEGTVCTTPRLFLGGTQHTVTPIVNMPRDHPISIPRSQCTKQIVHVAAATRSFQQKRRAKQPHPFAVGTYLPTFRFQPEQKNKKNKNSLEENPGAAQLKVLGLERGAADLPAQLALLQLGAPARGRGPSGPPPDQEPEPTV